jgi:CubicO group peptidase (beta-lactamase class C family)
MKKILFGFIITAGIAVRAQSISHTEIDSLAERTLKTFQVPGIAVAIIKDGKVFHARGYGVRSLKTKQKVDENTLFGIASNSKAFTAAALGMLIDEKKLTWDTKVVSIIPDFKLYNDYVTAEFTVRDLLTHRSGLGLGAGDLMIFPNGTDFTLNDIIHNLRYLKPVSAFRTQYDYDNLLYIVAGEVVSRISGMSWQTFIETKIMQPLQMNKSAAGFRRLKDTSDVIDAHAPVDGVVKVIARDFSETADAAAGIYSNLTDMSKWVMMQLEDGKYGDSLNKQLFSKEVHEEMWIPQTIIPIRSVSSYNTHFAGYGLGWFLSDVKGYKQASHTGGLAGIVTQVTMIPELKLGIIVFTNQQCGEAFSSITNTIKDRYLGMPKVDRIKQNEDNWLKKQADAKKTTDAIWTEITAEQKKATAKPDLALFTGTYTDKWFGEIIISIKKGKLWFDSKRSPRFSGEVFFYKEHTWIVKWNDRSMDADAFVIVDLDKSGKASEIKMKAISPLTDFSFDFQDLDFTRKN